MATWYWAAASGANFATANWATTHGGSPTGQPAAGDVAIFDSTSSQTCTIAANTVALLSFDCQGGTGNFAGTITHNAFQIIIGTGGGVFRLASGMTYTPASTSSVVSFTHTSLTCSLTSAGHNFAAITVNGVGGTVQLQDNLSCTAVASSIITLTAGTLDAYNSGANYTITCNLFSSPNGSTRAFSHGGLVTVGGSALANNASVINWGTTLSYTANSGNIAVNPGTAAVDGMSFNCNVAINNLTLNNSTTNYGIVPASFTCAALTMGSGWIFCSNANITCSSLTATGTASNPCGFSASSGVAGCGVISSGTCTLNWGILFNCAGTGGGTFTATNTMSGGLCSNWSITPPLTSAALVWTDLLSSSDFSTAGSVGAVMKLLQYGVLAIGRGTCTTGGSSTSVPTSAWTIAPNAANQFANSTMIFDSNTTTQALRGVRSAISASTNSATPTFTVAALPATPASGDTFGIF